MSVIESVRWAPAGDAVRIIDQRHLPERYEERDLRTLDQVCDAIVTLAVRGAPAIGVAGAMGLAVSLRPFIRDSASRFRDRIREHAARIRATRPTAVNLPWALDRMLASASRLADAPVPDLAEALHREADAIREEDRAMCRRIGEHALELVPDGARVLTHCNTGALATAGIGTALAAVYLAAESGRRIEVVVDETRPLLQGSRLTAWELSRAGIPVTVIVDSMAAALMRAGAVTLCLVGADRIASNGDVANKIGTYGLALAARHHGLPFYVAAPSSTIDRSLASGAAIEIERRSAEEVTHIGRQRVVPEGVRVLNPAFDVTPADLIAAIVTDAGIFRPPYEFASATPRRERATSVAGR